MTTLAMDTLVLFRGTYYEGASNSKDLRAVRQMPLLSPIVCDFVNKQEITGDKKPVFREDFYDPVTRIRRGRIYLGGRSAHDLGGVFLDGHSWNLGNLRLELYSYEPWVATGDFGDIRNRPVRIGSEGFESGWYVIDAERLEIGHILLTLKAKSFSGLIPEIKDTIQNSHGNTFNSEPIVSELNKFVDAYYRQQPNHVIDGAREATAVILRKWLQPNSNGVDLGKLIGLLPNGGGEPFKDNDESKALRCAASLINRLHPRGKSAERERQQARSNRLRENEEADAEAVAQLLGFILRDIRWAVA